MEDERGMNERSRAQVYRSYQGTIREVLGNYPSAREKGGRVGKLFGKGRGVLDSITSFILYIGWASVFPIALLNSVFRCLISCNLRRFT